MKLTNESKAKGGLARAAKLTPEQRSAIALDAAKQRWSKNSIQSSLEPGTAVAINTGNLKLGNSVLACAVLDDGALTRVMSRASFVAAIGRKGKVKGGRTYDQGLQTPVFLTAQNLQPFISHELLEKATPVLFTTGAGGQTMIGYRAELLPLVCEVFMDADEAGALKENQRPILVQCKLLYRGFARVGIVALVDEATGFQETRAKDALAEILRQFISDEWAKWAKVFPDDFYREMFRLRGLTYSEFTTKRPKIVGRLTNDIVYARLAPNVLDALREKNPTYGTEGQRRQRHHQWLTPEVGQQKLREHLASVTVLMRASSNWTGFVRLLDRALPLWKTRVQAQLPGTEDSENIP